MVKLFHIKIRKISFFHNSTSKSTTPTPKMSLTLSVPTSVWISPLTHFFIYGNLLKVFRWPCASQKTVCLGQNLFFLQNKGFNNRIWVGRHTKNNLRLFKLDSKTLLVCHSAVTSTKWQNMKATPTWQHVSFQNFWKWTGNLTDKIPENSHYKKNNISRTKRTGKPI